MTGGGATPLPTTYINSIVERKETNAESQSYAKFLCVGSNADGQTYLLAKMSVSGDDQTLYFYSLGQDSTVAHQDNGNLYPVVNSSWSISEEGSQTLESWFETNKDGFLDEGIIGLIDVNVAVSQMQQTTGRTYIVH